MKAVAAVIFTGGLVAMVLGVWTVGPALMIAAVIAWTGIEEAEERRIAREQHTWAEPLSGVTVIERRGQ